MTVHCMYEGNCKKKLKFSSKECSLKVSFQCSSNCLYFPPVKRQFNFISSKTFHQPFNLTCSKIFFGHSNESRKEHFCSRGLQLEICTAQKDKKKIAKGAHEPKAQTVRAYPSFLSIKYAYDTRHKLLKQKPFFLNFLKNFLNSILTPLFSLKCTPSLSQC